MGSFWSHKGYVRLTVANGKASDALSGGGDRPSWKIYAATIRSLIWRSTIHHRHFKESTSQTLADALSISLSPASLLQRERKKSWNLKGSLRRRTMSDEEHHFESKADAGASKTYPQQAGTIRKNGYLVIKGRPCKVWFISFIWSFFFGNYWVVFRV